MLINTPYIKCYVDNNFIKSKEGRTEGYIFAITAIINRPHLFHIHTVDGAIYSRLPIWALYSQDYRSNNLDKKELEPYGVIGEKSQVVKLKYLKDYRPIYKKKDGRYLFSIEPLEGGFSEDPEQQKTLHFIEINNQFAILPNNYLRFYDSHFTKESKDRYYRTTEYFLSNG